MKQRTKLLCATISAAVMFGSAVTGMLTACDWFRPKMKLTDKTLSATTIADYTKTAEERKETFESGSKGYSWENGEPFNVWWKPENVTYDNNRMSLAISEMTKQETVYNPETGKDEPAIAKYYGAETRTEHYYGYGDFQVRMKPAKVVGTASTFFTCTGPYDQWYAEDGETVIKKNDHDEIDIEFLGKDTTKVQFNYFASGKGGHEYMYSLGFDASKEFHDYGFRWTETYITWFVDGKPVYRVDRKSGEDWPEDPGRMVMNYWCGTKNASAWMGEFKNDYSGRAQYEWIQSSAEQQPDPNTAHIKPVDPGETTTVPTEGWTPISVENFDGWGSYTVDKESGLTISHDEAKSGYACCGMPLEQSYSWVKFNVKNNAETPADARIDLKKEGGTGGVAAVVSEHAGVTFNSVDSAVSIRLGGNESAEVAVQIKDTLIDQMVVFLNSMDSASSATGSITITDLQGIVNSEAVPPEPVDDVTLTVNDQALTFSGNLGEGAYTLSADKECEGITAEYTDLKGNGYFNINAPVAEIAKNHNVFTVKLRNNGAEAANVRIDVNSTTKVNETTACNVSAKQDGVEVYTDTTYGGSTFTVAPGATVTAEVTYDPSRNPTTIMFYFDSSKYDDEGTHTGSVTFFEAAFSGEVTVDPGTDPVPPVGDNVALTFTSTETYIVDRSGEAAESINVTYTAVQGATYANISAADAKTYAQGKNTFSLEIANTGDTAAVVRVDLIGERSVGNTDVCNLSHVIIGGSDGGYTDTEWGGTSVTLQAGEKITLVITYVDGGERGNIQRVQLYMDSSVYGDTATHGGSISFGNFCFSMAE